MGEALGADGHGFLEQHDALIRLVAEELQGGEAARRRHVEMLPTARGYDKAFRCVHVGDSFMSTAILSTFTEAEVLLPRSEPFREGPAAGAGIRRRSRTGFRAPTRRTGVPRRRFHNRPAGPGERRRRGFPAAPWRSRSRGTWKRSSR